MEEFFGFHGNNFITLCNSRVDLSSEEFCGHLRPFLFDKTEHFIHEFVSFARSPFDMNTYDGRVQYSWPGESREQARDTPTVFHSHTAGWGYFFGPMYYIQFTLPQRAFQP